MALTTQDVNIQGRNEVELYRCKESKWGVTPTSPALTQIRAVSSDFKQTIGRRTSNEARSDRMNAGSMRTSASSAGGFEAELSHGEYDPELGGVLQSEFSTPINISAATIAATTSGFKAASGTPFTGIVAGQWLKVTGFSDASINGFYKVKKVNSNTDIETSIAPANTESAGRTVKMKGKYVRNGKLGNSFTYQERHTGLETETFINSTGQYIESLSLKVAEDGVTARFGTVGKSTTVTETQFTGATDRSPTNNPIMDAIDGLKDVTLDGEVDGEYLIDITLEIKNNIDSVRAVGQGIDAIGATPGKLEVSASLNMFFLDKGQMDDYIAGTVKSLSFRLEDSKGNVLIITIPAATFDDFTPTGVSNSGNSQASAKLVAHRDPETNCMIQFDVISA